MNKTDIDALVSTPVPEGRTIDYKESLGDLGSDKGKGEFLRDVSSFANTAGGTIYFGISEARDERNQQTGVPEAALGLADFNRDLEISRIENVLATGIEPRVSVSPEVIDGFPNGPVLALRIHQSWTGPHMAREGRFYARDNSGKKLMDYHMIRSSFVSFLSLTEEVRSFQQERVRAIFEGRTPLPLDRNDRLVIHAMPLSAFVPATRRLIPISELDQHRSTVSFRDVYAGRPNLDGLLVRHKSEAGSAEYIQMFRNGILERVHTGFTWNEGGVLQVIGDDIVKSLRMGISRFLQTQRSLGIAPPIVVMVAVKGVGGHVLVQGNESYAIVRRGLQEGFDRDELILPEMLCDDLDAPYEPLIAKLIDIFWQAAGKTGVAK